MPSPGVQQFQRFAGLLIHEKFFLIKQDILLETLKILSKLKPQN